MSANQLQNVTFVQAKGLKELGFDWPTRERYFSDGTVWLSETSRNHNSGDGVSAPTLALAQKWMRDVNGYSSYIIRNNENRYTFCYQRPIDDTIVFLDKFYDTYDAADSAALDAIIDEMERSAL